jgi:type III pantothenate kinase
MNLVIDIGNTNIVFGLKQADKWLHIWRMNTDRQTKGLEYNLALQNMLWELGVAPNDIKNKILSTVVPELKNVFINILDKLNNRQTLVLDQSIYNKLPLNIPSQEEIGSDLVANALAANQLYKENLIIIDFGTALTFTVVNQKGEILGVNIAPGLKTALNALGDKASQLDTVPLKLPDYPLGVDTETALQNGVLLGYIGLISFMIETIKQTVGQSYKVLSTGGLVNVLKDKLSQLDYINQNLTLEGLALIPDLIQNKA